eukprot:TRINITY_DN10156_c0_g3_i1.p3 TRINITY_DN10156_c0_g3~~TRINITY_DN10156_c0_g3_i1.p3  ORF type:complete len:164 (-),score=21.12 TRINITY_DN10156_c0_g3_i1:229-720(-)
MQKEYVNDVHNLGYAGVKAVIGIKLQAIRRKREMTEQYFQTGEQQNSNECMDKPVRLGKEEMQHKIKRIRYLQQQTEDWLKEQPSKKDLPKRPKVSKNFDIGVAPKQYQQVSSATIQMQKVDKQPNIMKMCNKQLRMKQLLEQVKSSQEKGQKLFSSQQAISA